MGESKSEGDTARSSRLTKSAAGRVQPPVYKFCAMTVAFPPIRRKKRAAPPVRGGPLVIQLSDITNIRLCGGGSSMHPATHPQRERSWKAPAPRQGRLPPCRGQPLSRGSHPDRLSRIRIGYGGLRWRKSKGSRCPHPESEPRCFL